MDNYQNDNDVREEQRRKNLEGGQDENLQGNQDQNLQGGQTQGQPNEEMGDKTAPMTIEEAARKGGNTTKQRYGPDFYSRIGRKGGQRVARERGPEFYSEIGRKGGEARVAQSRKLERQREPEDAQE